MRVGLLAFACFDLGDGSLDQPGALGVSERGQPGLPDFTAPWSIAPMPDLLLRAKHLLLGPNRISDRARAARSNFGRLSVVRSRLHPLKKVLLRSRSWRGR